MVYLSKTIMLKKKLCYVPKLVPVAGRKPGHRACLERSQMSRALKLACGVQASGAGGLCRGEWLGQKVEKRLEKTSGRSWDSAWPFTI